MRVRKKGIELIWSYPAKTGTGGEKHIWWALMAIAGVSRMNTQPEKKEAVGI